MRDLSPSPLDITRAAFASNATMLRKSRASPPATCSRFQLLPRSLEKRITPFEPHAHTTTCWPVESGLSAALMPRKLVGSSLLGALNHGAPAVALHNIAATAVKVSVRMRIPRILTIFRAQLRDL